MKLVPIATGLVINISKIESITYSEENPLRSKITMLSGSVIEVPLSLEQATNYINDFEKNKNKEIVRTHSEFVV